MPSITRAHIRSLLQQVRDLHPSAELGVSAVETVMRGLGLEELLVDPEFDDLLNT
ncbi:unnamed protein product [Amoebophrya sp. A25]|nr:unnamed protein product [Amoebophrya sp. A25]|eukprot:GSA25T00020288001.1